MDYILLILGFTLIIFGAVMLTDGSVALAHRFKVPEFIVGLTVVAVGTSMPELVVSFISAIEGKGDMSIGNVIGSNIFNIYAVLGVCALFVPIGLTSLNIRRDIPLCLIVTLALLGVVYFDGNISSIEGALLFLGYILVILYSIRSEKRGADSATSEEGSVDMPTWRIPIWIIGGLCGLIYGGSLAVDSASAIALSWGVSEAVIAITLVAGGTSLPELASSLVALIKGKTSLALGNVLGSNIANVLLILGTCSLIEPLTMGDVLTIDFYVAISAVVMLLFSALFIGRNRISRLEAVVFLMIYAAYIYTLVVR